MVTTILGFAGVPDDLETWYRWFDVLLGWIDAVVNDPLALALARHAVTVADFVNQDWFRVTLVLGGLVVMIWPLRWFWRLRHNLRYRWRRALVEQVWISDEDAKRVMRDSPWGQLKEPTITIGYSFLDNLVGKREIISGLSEGEKKLVKFNAYISRTLDKFCENNSDAVRVVDGKREVDEVALRKFLDLLVEKELIQDFGDIPDIRLG
ncbi:hypothetical protein [Microvirga massiliensis]|uniref:hypothetical protein n=1 Tax=Microvirga massiliensis TaxID=1033741 RepID=UPI0011CCBB98|nr:hypothetical protein [Microvirga massiliensis]